MTWRNINTLSHKKPMGDSTRIAVEKNFIVIRPSRPLTLALGWKEKTKIGISVGEGEHAGLVRLEESPAGWSLRSAGGGNQDGALSLKFTKLLGGADVFPGMPSRLSSVAVETTVDGAAVEFRLPWAPVVVVASPPRQEAPSPVRLLPGDPAGVVFGGALLGDVASPKTVPPGFVDTGARGITAAARGKVASPDEPRPIPAHILKFLRAEVIPVLSPLGRKIIKTRDGAGLLLDGQPATVDEIVAEANRIVGDTGRIVVPAMAAE